MAELKYDKKTGRLLFTKQMKKEYTILMPNMAPIHFKILEKVFNYYGYKSDLLNTTGPEIAQTGLKCSQRHLLSGFAGYRSVHQCFAERKV